MDVPSALGGVRLDRAVAFLADVTRAEAARLVDDGGITLNGSPVHDRARRLKEHDRLSIDQNLLAQFTRPPDLPTALKPVPFDVLFEDGDLIVVSKPAGVVVHPGAGNRVDTLAAGLLARYPELARLPEAGAGERDRPGIVHRLDKDTSGVLVVARTVAAFGSLTAQLARRAMGRTYLALVLGHLEASAGLIDAPIGRSVSEPTRMAVSGGGKAARTSYEVLARFSKPLAVSSLEVHLETGRTHQIRVHVAAIGHPVLGDRRYGGARGAMPVKRPMLHAWRLSVEHPATGNQLVFEAEPPADFQRALADLS
ncbi:MAG: RluA family pseudouridine synthase [Acidimicrobiales bacterium]